MSQKSWVVFSMALCFGLAFSPTARADGVIPQRIICDSPNGNYKIEYKSPQEVWALYPGDNRDLDKDTLVDDVEKYLAGVFAPALLLDSAEMYGDLKWNVQTMCGEPFTNLLHPEWVEWHCMSNATA